MLCFENRTNVCTLHELLVMNILYIFNNNTTFRSRLKPLSKTRSQEIGNGRKINEPNIMQDFSSKLSVKTFQPSATDCNKFVSQIASEYKIVNHYQKRERVRASEKKLTLFKLNNERFVTRYVTMMKLGTHYNNPECKQQSMQWQHQSCCSPGKFKCKHPLVNLWSHFWDPKGVLLIDCLEQGHPITAHYHEQLIPKLRDAIHEKMRKI